jgi:hypothetical protein
VWHCCFRSCAAPTATNAARRACARRPTRGMPVWGTP